VCYYDRMKLLKLEKFGHEYCGPCKTMETYLPEVVEELKEIADFENVDTYNVDPEKIKNAGIRAVPTLLLYKEGVEVWRHVGLLSKDAIVAKVKEYV
jgi:thioredoxin 1